MKKIVTYGEIMLRLSSPLNKRFIQSNNFEISFAGSEANVAVSLSKLGLKSEFITKLPKNDISDFCISELKKHGVIVDNIILGGDRIGIMYLESGAVFRPSKVIYDRENSAISTINEDDINWERIVKDAQWFHWSGITPAISEKAANNLKIALDVAHHYGIVISCDLNYRNNLWLYGKEAREVMPELVSFSDIILGNEDDAENSLGIYSKNLTSKDGKKVYQQDGYKDVCNEISLKFPRARIVAITIRNSINANHNKWSSILWTKSSFYKSQEYDISHIVDRIGAGDSYMAGLIYGIINYSNNMEYIVNFATAASCLKHTIHHDFNLISLAEIEYLLNNNLQGRIIR